MHKLYTCLFLFIFFTGCVTTGKKDKSDRTGTSSISEFTVYSESIHDSFVISVQLPAAYSKDTLSGFPTVYMVDGNFYFPMMAAVLRQYEMGGLLPPFILVGIGYKTFALMDSLRVRDYLYPAAMPSDEIKTEGGGKNFDEFITDQLIPYIDSSYNTDKNNRCLMGHSFGGYFSLFALLQQTTADRAIFRNFVSASPSLWYNNFYLDQLTEKLKNRKAKDSLNIFLSAGGFEDSTWNIAPVRKLADDVKKNKIKGVNIKYHIYNDLGHMDVANLTFTKGLQEFYNKPGE